MSLLTPRLASMACWTGRVLLIDTVLLAVGGTLVVRAAGSSTARCFVEELAPLAGGTALLLLSGRAGRPRLGVAALAALAAVGWAAAYLLTLPAVSTAHDVSGDLRRATVLTSSDSGRASFDQDGRSVSEQLAAGVGTTVVFQRGHPERVMSEADYRSARHGLLALAHVGPALLVVGLGALTGVTRG